MPKQVKASIQSTDLIVEVSAAGARFAMPPSAASAAGHADAVARVVGEIPGSPSSPEFRSALQKQMEAFRKKFSGIGRVLVTMDLAAAEQTNFLKSKIFAGAKNVFVVDGSANRSSGRKAHVHIPAGLGTLAVHVHLPPRPPVLRSPATVTVTWRSDGAALVGTTVIEAPHGAPARGITPVRGRQQSFASGAYTGSWAARFNGLLSLVLPAQSSPVDGSYIKIDADVMVFSTSGRQTIVRTDSYALSVNDGTLEFSLLSGGVWWHAQTGGDLPLSPGLWMAVEAVYDGNALFLYVGGVLRAMAPAPAADAWTKVWLGGGPGAAQSGSNPALPGEIPFSGVLGPVVISGGSPAPLHLLEFSPALEFRLGNTPGGFGDVTGNVTPGLGTGVAVATGPTEEEPALWFAGSGAAKLAIPFSLTEPFSSESMFTLTLDVMPVAGNQAGPATLVEFGHFRLDISGTALRVHDTAGSGASAAAGNAGLFQWTRIVAVQDGSGLKCYNEGVLRGTLPGSAATVSGSAPLSLGGSLAGRPFFKGYLCRVALWRGVLPVTTALASLEVVDNAAGDKGTGGVTWNVNAPISKRSKLEVNSPAGLAPASFGLFSDTSFSANDPGHVLESQPAWTIEAQLSAIVTQGNESGLFQCGAFNLDFFDELRLADVHGPHYFRMVYLDHAKTIRAVQDGVNFRFYVDGELLLEEPSGNVPMPAATALRVGGFTGSLSYFRIWPQAFSPAPAYRNFLTLASGLWQDLPTWQSEVYAPKIRAPQDNDLDLIPYTPGSPGTPGANTTPGLFLAYPDIPGFLSMSGNATGGWLKQTLTSTACNIQLPAGGKTSLLGQYYSQADAAALDMSTCTTWADFINTLNAASGDISPATLLSLIEKLNTTKQKMAAFFSALQRLFIQPSISAKYDLNYTNAPAGSPHLPTWRTAFDNTAGVSAADLPNITDITNQHGAGTPTSGKAFLLASWETMVNACFGYIAYVLTNFLWYSALQTIGYFAAAEQSLAQEDWNPALDHYGKAIQYMPSLTGATAPLLKNVTIQKAGASAQTDASALTNPHEKPNPKAIKILSTSKDDLFTILENIGLAIPFGQNAAHRELALNDAANAATLFHNAQNDFLEADPNWYMPSGMAFFIAEWLALASTSIDQGRQAFLNRNTQQAEASYQMVFRDQLAKFILQYGSSTPIDPQVYALRVRAATMLLRLARGETPFGLSNNYVPPVGYPALLTAANNAIAQASQAATDYMNSRQQAATQSARLSVLKVALNTQEQNLAAAQPAVTAAQNALNAAYEGVQRALAEQQQTQRKATILALLSSGGKILADLAGPAVSFFSNLQDGQTGQSGKPSSKSNAQQKEDLKAQIKNFFKEAQKYMGLIGGADKAVNDFLAARQKILSDAAAAVKGAQKQVSDALGAWAEAVATYRTASAEVAALGDQYNTYNSPNTEFSAAWWYHRADQLSRIAQTWIDFAIVNVWSLQQSAENLTDQGDFPLNFSALSGLNNTGAASPVSTDPNLAIYNLKLLLTQVDQGGGPYPGFATGASLSVLPSRSRTFSLKDRAPLQVIGLGANNGVAVFDISPADLEYAANDSVPGDFHEMVTNVGAVVTYDPDPAHPLTGNETLAANVLVPTPSVVRIYDSGGNYPAGEAPITNSGEWFRTPPAFYKLKEKIWDVGMAVALQLNPENSTGTDRLFGGSTETAAYDGSGILQGSGLARLWIVQILGGASWLDWDRIRDVSLVFDMIGGPGNTGERYQHNTDFCNAVANEVRDVSPTASKTLYYSAGAPDAAGAFSIDVPSADMGSSAAFNPVLRTVYVVLVPQQGANLSAGQLTLVSQGQTFTAPLEIVEGVLGLATFSFTGQRTVPGSFAFTLAGSPSAVDNAVVLLEYSYTRQAIVCGA